MLTTKQIASADTYLDNEKVSIIFHCLNIQKNSQDQNKTLCTLKKGALRY